MIGPHRPSEILLCSADASPKSQKAQPAEAGIFFPGAKWVGAVRNSARRMQCPFLILSTAYGMVTNDEIINPFDLHIDVYPEKVKEIWNRTIPSVLSNKRYRIMVFYAGGCPRESYIDLIKPLLK